MEIPDYPRHLSETNGRTPGENSRKIKNAALRIFCSIAGLCVFVYLFNGFRIYTVEGPSMEPALEEGAGVLVYRWAYGIPRFRKSGYYLTWKSPARNDIITFYNPAENVLSVKRCAGTAGDSLRLVRDVFYINDSPLPPGKIPPAAALQNGRIPEGYIFMLGDNPRESLDSRYFGPVSLDYVVGKVLRRNITNE